jgi:long-chain acyl-CoA synthetase
LGFWWIAEEHPDQPAVVECPSGYSLSFGELAGRAHQLVHALRSRGVRQGQIVAYALPNDVDVLYWQLATQESGLVFISLNPALAGGEIRSVLDHSGASAVVVHSQYSDRVGDLFGADTVKLRVSVGGDIEGFERFESLLEGHPATKPEHRALGGSISYSSGTTGKPKAIVRPTMTRGPDDAADDAKLFARAFRFQPLEGTHLVSAGMHHGGCQSFYMGALNVGQSLAILARFDPEKTLRTIQEQRVSTAYMVPTQFVRLLRLPEEVRTSYDVSSLQVVVHSAAPCPRDIKQQMMDWWGPVIWETYGGMEGAATIAKPHRWLQKPGTVGRPVNGMRVRILDDDDQELPANQVGHVYLEPARKTFEYRDDPELTASITRGRAFTLGDIGYLDGDGYLFLRDRAKDMIISGGINIYPADVEGVLSSHPSVGDVAVIGVPDVEWGESVKAVVEPTTGVSGSEKLAEELIEYCRAHLAHYKCPRSVDFRETLPRTDGGKLYKRLLRDEYWSKAGRNL